LGGREGKKDRKERERPVFSFFSAYPYLRLGSPIHLVFSCSAHIARYIQKINAGQMASIISYHPV
jgi:hypothetical protein